MDLMTVIFVGLITIFLLWRLLSLYRSRQMQGRSVPDINSLLSERQKVSSRLLIYFWSQQCVMCKGMSKIIAELAETHDDILKIDAMQNMEITAGFGIMGTPSLVLVNEGKIEKMMLGTKSKSQIIEILDRDHTEGR